MLPQKTFSITWLQTNPYNLRLWLDNFFGFSASNWKIWKVMPQKTFSITWDQTNPKNFRLWLLSISPWKKDIEHFSTILRGIIWALFKQFQPQKTFSITWEQTNPNILRLWLLSISPLKKRYWTFFNHFERRPFELFSNHSRIIFWFHRFSGCCCHCKQIKRCRRLRGEGERRNEKKIFVNDVEAFFKAQHLLRESLLRALLLPVNKRQMLGHTLQLASLLVKLHCTVGTGVTTATSVDLLFTGVIYPFWSVNFRFTSVNFRFSSVI